ncbi:hypothetical protein OGAPHI_002439 [Ogataea philodendri]|uniref:Uncharacterized protein n=1 Tax=Ogataea philodendri TaxID=1378263 RepID=A0A9P8PBG9_9ASCO|nr:uncharacterized protein OGAPHI_002439 [Ogataea philodendri]KAH3668685.1 hypothetical protein OGAPHI_002439 [Ogataea philodendri]
MWPYPTTSTTGFEASEAERNPCSSKRTLKTSIRSYMTGNGSETSYLYTPPSMLEASLIPSLQFHRALSCVSSCETTPSETIPSSMMDSKKVSSLASSCSLEEPDVSIKT